VNEIYASFAGIIDENSLRKILESLNASTRIIEQGKTVIEHIHLLFQSNGGNISDGICLYNYFRKFPLPITLYNCGQISSIGTIAYLGAKSRKTAASATFMVHKAHFTFNAAQSHTLEGFIKSTVIDDARILDILKSNCELGPKKLTEFIQGTDCWFTAQDAIDAKIANGIADFSPPIGQQIYNI
jgi:ATP-dependent Clp protease protease subunit